MAHSQVLKRIGVLCVWLCWLSICTQIHRNIASRRRKSTSHGESRNGHSLARIAAGTCVAIRDMSFRSSLIDVCAPQVDPGDLAWRGANESSRVVMTLSKRHVQSLKDGFSVDFWCVMTC
jgi:hypothetical protein